jgi:hypothetical protein
MGVVNEINRLTKSLETAVGKYVDLTKKTIDSPANDGQRQELDAWAYHSLVEKWNFDTRAELRRSRSAKISKSKLLLNDILKTENTSDRQQLLYEYIKIHDPATIDAAVYAKPLEALANTAHSQRSTPPALPVSDMAECRSTVRAAPFFVTKQDLRDMLVRQTKLTATEATKLSRDDMCKILFARSLEEQQPGNTVSKKVLQVNK